MQLQAGESIPVTVVEARLSGIESELRALRGLVERLVRVEERIAASQQQVAALQSELTALRGRLDTTAAAGQRAAWTISGIERLFWLVVAAAVGVLASRFG